VVDSEDVPLNLSREHLQDSSTIKRLGGVISRRIIKFFEKEAKDNEDKYAKFYNEFNSYIKEGVCTDFTNKEEIAKLLRMESLHTSPGKQTSLEDYVSRMKPEQKEIFYLIVPTRQFAEHSPYFENFKSSDTEVLFLYDTRLDDFVMSNLGDFKGKKLKTIESSIAADAAKSEPVDTERKGLSREEFKDFSKWMKDVLVDRVTTVTETDRLSSTPCIIVDHESASFRRMMKSVDPKNAPELPKQQVQINARHSIIVRINEIRKADSSSEMARDAISQVFDNALIQAGLIDDSRSMVPRINKLLEKALEYAANASKGEKSVGEAHPVEVDVPELKGKSLEVPEPDPFVEPKKEKTI
jgi:HSP90 family molecular chaperone